MYGRALQTVIRLFPGNNYQCPDNPLQLDRLPNDAGVELDYPVFQEPPEAAARHTLLYVALPALAAPVLGWAAEWIWVPMIHGGLDTLALLLALAAVIFGATGRYSALVGYAIAAVLLPMFALIVRDAPFSVAALLVALAGTCLFAGSLVTNYVHLKTAAPVERHRAQEIRAQWGRRWSNPLRALMGSELYPLGFLLAVAAGWLFLRSLANPPNTTSFFAALRVFLWAALLGFLWSVAMEALLAPLFGRRPTALKAQLGAVFRATVEWCTYNRLNTRGVGVHRSPVGNCVSRRYLLVGTVLAWACLWASWQLPSAEELAGMKQQVMAQAMEHYRELLRQMQVPLPSQQSASMPEFTPAEVELLHRLSPDAAEEYKRQRIEAYAEQQKQNPGGPDSTRKPGAMLLVFFKELARVAVDVIVPSVCTVLAAAMLVFGMVSRSLAGVEALLGAAPRRRVLSTENWKLLVGRVRSSADKLEKGSVFLGTNAVDDTPILVPREVFHEHAHILGDTGSGKTSLGLLPLISQLIRFGDSSVIIVDLKADDQVVFESLKHDCDQLSEQMRKTDRSSLGYPLRWLTTVVGRSSFAFNPLRQRVMPLLTPDQRTDVLTAGLGLQYGTDYGRKYYGDANYDLLNRALRNHPDVQNFAELEWALVEAAGDLPSELRRAASHVISSVRRLSRCKALNASPSLKSSPAVLNHAIDLADFLERPQALYVALPPTSGISNTAEIARIFLYSLLAAAQMTPPKDRKQVYLVVDEFQRIVANNVELFLQQARSMNVACIFSNQSLADLNKIDTDLIPAVRANTRFRQVFGAGNQTDLEDLLATAGETMYGSRSWNFRQGAFFDNLLSGFSVAETRGSRLSINDILLATDAPGRNITYVRRGAGYAQFGGMPFKMDSVHHTSEKLFGDRKKAVWPRADARMVVAQLDDEPPLPGEGPVIIDKEPPPSPPPARGPDAPDEPDDGGSGGMSPTIIDDVYDELEAEQDAQRRRRKAKRPPRQ